MTTNEMYDFLLEYSIATADELSLVSCINGYNTHTMECVLYARTGWRSFEGFLEELNGEDE